MESAMNRSLVCPKIIGRLHERAGLREIVEQAKGGHGQVVVMAGEAGVGKSRLVAETRAIAQAEGFLILQGSCFPTDRNCPYGPLLDLLRPFLTTDAGARIITELGPLTAALIPLFPELVPSLEAIPLLPPLDGEQEKRRLFVCLAQVLTSQSDV